MSKKKRSLLQQFGNLPCQSGDARCGSPQLFYSHACCARLAIGINERDDTEVTFKRNPKTGIHAWWSQAAINLKVCTVHGTSLCKRMMMIDRSTNKTYKAILQLLQAYITSSRDCQPDPVAFQHLSGGMMFSLPSLSNFACAMTLSGSSRPKLQTHTMTSPPAQIKYQTHRRPMLNHNG